MTEQEVRVLEVLVPSAGGIGRHVAQLKGDLDGSGGLSIDVAGPSSGAIGMPEPVIELTIPPGAFGHSGVVDKLRSVVEEGGYDVVHAHGLRAGIDAARACKKSGTPVLLTVHNLVRPEVKGRLRAWLYRPAEKLAIRSARHVFGVSKEIVNHLRSLLPARAEDIELLHPSVGDIPRPRESRAEVRRELGVAASSSLVVTVARLDAQKSIHVLIESLQHIKSDVIVAILGEGPLASDLKQMAAQLRVDSAIRWLGWRSNVADFVAAAHVFCLPSAWEGFPLAAQEAILLGVPLVVTDVGGLPELVTDRISGRLVRHGDPGVLAAALDEVLADSAGAAAMAAAALDNLKKNFSRPEMNERLAAAYRDAAAGV